VVKLTIIVCIGINLFVCGTVLAKSGIEVTGIIHKDTPIAIINDKIVQEGDEIDGYLIEKIGSNYVKLRYENKLIVKNVTGKQLSQETNPLKNQKLNKDQKQMPGRFQKGKFPLLFSLIVLIAGGLAVFLALKNKPAG